jgi:hypothetical protein
MDDTSKPPDEEIRFREDLVILSDEIGARVELPEQLLSNRFLMRCDLILVLP